jgi:sphinganine C4-monooxygenase
MKEVVKAVIFQQVIQTILGLVWLEDDEVLLKRDHYRDHLGEMATLAPKVAGSMMLALGQRTAEDLLRNHGAAIVRWVYWWGIPTARILFAL